MFTEEEGPAEAATGFSDQFVDAGIAKLDACFGAGYAKENPQALAAYLTASASNLNAFMTAAMTMQETAFDEALEAFEEDLPPPPAPEATRRRR